MDGSQVTVAKKRNLMLWLCNASHFIAYIALVLFRISMVQFCASVVMSGVVRARYGFVEAKCSVV